MSRLFSATSAPLTLDLVPHWGVLQAGPGSPTGPTKHGRQLVTQAKEGSREAHHLKYSLFAMHLVSATPSPPALNNCWPQHGVPFWSERDRHSAINYAPAHWWRSHEPSNCEEYALDCYTGPADFISGTLVFPNYTLTGTSSRSFSIS
jgi:hypothetical protein